MALCKLPNSLLIHPKAKRGAVRLHAKDFITYIICSGLRDTVSDETMAEFMGMRAPTLKLEGSAYYVLLIDYVDKVRTDPRYPIISGQFLEALPVEIKLDELERKLEAMIIKYFYDQKRDTYKDDALMMLFLVAADLVNAALSVPDVNRALRITQLATKKVPSRQIRFSQIFFDWTEKYDHLVDPRRTIEPIENEELLEKQPTVLPPPLAAKPKPMDCTNLREKPQKRRATAAKNDPRITMKDLKTPPKTHKVVESFIAGRLDKHMVANKPPALYPSNRTRYDVRRLGVAMNDYADKIESTEMYQALMTFTTNFLKTSDTPTASLSRIISDYILTDNRIVFYDQIMTMLLLVSDLIVQEVQIPDITRATHYYMVINAHISVCSLKMKQLVTSTWVELADIQDKLLDRDEEEMVLMSDPIVTGISPKIDRTEQESAAIFQNQESPFIYDPKLPEPQALAGPPTPGQSSTGSSTTGPSTPGTSTPGPSTPGPSTPGPSTPGLSTPGPSTARPSTPRLPTPGSSAAGPSTTEPSSAADEIVDINAPSVAVATDSRGAFPVTTVITTAFPITTTVTTTCTDTNPTTLVTTATTTISTVSTQPTFPGESGSINNSNKSPI